MDKKIRALILSLIILVSTILLLDALDFLTFVAPLLTIKGKVTDEYGDPIGGAEVCVGNHTTYTALNGSYTLEVPKGVYNMTVSAKGYKTFNSSLTITEPKLSCDVTLKKERAIELKPSDETFKLNSSSCIEKATRIIIDGCRCGENDAKPLFLIRGITNTSYIRNLVGELYENGSWLLPEKAQTSQYSGGSISNGITSYVKASPIGFEIQPLTVFGGFIPSVKNPNYILFDYSLTYYVDQQIFFSEHTFTNSYNISYTLYEFDVEMLKEARTSPDSRYLNVPQELLEKLQPLALNITSNSDSTFEKLLALEDFLRKNYKYDKNYTRAPVGVDPVEWFLFHSKHGVCTHFNSAFVLLARSIGVPARLVAGYLIDPLKENQMVTPCQRHAYAEVLFENLGWITFDATAPCNCMAMARQKIKFKIIYPSQGAYISGSRITIAGEAFGFYKDAEFYMNRTGFSLTYWDGYFVFDNSTFIPDGELSVTVGISDFAGNNASDVVRFIVDNTPPKVEITFPSNGTSMINYAIFVNGSIQELNKGNLNPYINDTRFTMVYWNESTGAFSFVNNTNISGEVSVEVSFKDLAGNVGSNVVSFAVESEVLERIPTETMITNCSEIALKGSTFFVMGKVVDVNGGGVSDLNVLVYITKNKNESGMLCGQGRVVDGFFNITCYISEEIMVGDYLVIAHTIGDARYEDSWSDPKMRVITETIVEFSSPEKVIMGRSFTVNGTLKEKLTGEPIANKNVTLTINSHHYLLMTNNQGRILGNFTLWNPGNYTITLTFEGSDYYLNSTHSRTLKVLNITISPTTNETFTRGEPAHITGRVHAEDLPLDFEKLTINLNGETINVTSTDSEGFFNVTFHVPKNQTLGPATLEYQLEHCLIKAQQNINIVAKSFLKCVTPETLRAGEKLNLTATLTDDLQLPIENATIQFIFHFKDDEITVEGLTDSNGAAKAFNVTFPEDFAGNLTYTAFFPGNSLYLTSSYSGTVHIFNAPSSPNVMLFLAAGLPILAAATSAFILRRKRRSPRASEEKPKEKGAEEVGATSEKEMVTLNIEFPQIPEPFPPVWGVGETIDVRLSLNKTTGQPIPSAIITLKVDEKREEKLKTENDGKAETSYAFREKGVHTFRAFYSCDGENAAAEAELRIVDYREEVVDLFNSFYKYSMERFQGVKEEITPRELQSTLAAQVSPSKHEPLETVISIFEVANYSLHSIARKEYEQMYLSIKKFWS